MMERGLNDDHGSGDQGERLYTTERITFGLPSKDNMGYTQYFMSF